MIQRIMHLRPRVHLTPRELILLSLLALTVVLIIVSTGIFGIRESRVKVSTYSPLDTSRYGLAAVAYHDYLYIMGGNDGSSYYNAVQYAPISSNGKTGVWTTNSTSFTDPRYGFDAIAYHGYLYIMGGVGINGVTLNDVQYALINANGSIGAWKVTASFPTDRFAFGALAYNGYLYALGGSHDGGKTYLNDVHDARINSNGTIDSWRTTTSFTTARWGFAAVAYKSYLYIMGGYNGKFLDDVQYASIEDNGAIGSWRTTTSFTTARSNLQGIAYKGYLYVMGGRDKGSAGLNDIQYTPMSGNGAIGSWTAVRSSTAGRYSFSAVIEKGYLYIMGGISGSHLDGIRPVQLSLPVGARAR